MGDSNSESGNNPGNRAASVAEKQATPAKTIPSRRILNQTGMPIECRRSGGGLFSIPENWSEAPEDCLADPRLQSLINQGLCVVPPAKGEGR